jgi:alpha-1,6-mannosyltransferase
MVFCDIASFFAPRGGGVATYHNRKLAFFAGTSVHRYVIIAPASADRVEVVPGGRIYWVKGFRYDANYHHIYRLPALRRILKNVRPDVVEFGSPYLDYWIGVLACAGLDAVRTAFYHCDFPDTYVRAFLRKHSIPVEDRIIRLFYRYIALVYGRLDATLVPSEFIHAKLRRLGLRNLRYIPLGVDADTFHPCRKDESYRCSLGIGKDDKLLFYCGRYREDKGVGLLLEAVPRILDDRRLHLAFAGTGPLEKRIRMMAGRRANVHELGFISSRDTLAKAYASADGFLSPGGRETFGLGIAEALACGVPVLSADAGAGAQMIRRFGCGLLFRDGDATELSKKARELTEMDFREATAEARKHLEKHHNWHHIFNSYVHFHEKLRA